MNQDLVCPQQTEIRVGLEEESQMMLGIGSWRAHCGGGRSKKYQHRPGKRIVDADSWTIRDRTFVSSSA